MDRCGFPCYRCQTVKPSTASSMFSEMDDLHDSLMHSGTYLADPALPSNVCWTRQGRKCMLCVTSPDDDEADLNGALLSVVVKISEDGFWLSRYVFEFWQYHTGFKHSFVTATLSGRNRRSHPLRWLMQRVPASASNRQNPPSLPTSPLS